MKNEYMLIAANTPGELSASVNQCQQSGWELWGNHSISWNGKNFIFCQAMIKTHLIVTDDTFSEKVDMEAAGYGIGVPEESHD
jgi:hypothetical protein